MSLHADSDPRGAGARRLVVDLVGNRDHGLLAESRFVDRTFVPGGERSMAELAFAGAALGYDVELRGWLDRSIFEQYASAAGASPRVELPARRPEPGDLVVVPEGWQDPLDYARILLSPARMALYVLAVPGLFGWPFTAGWSRPDPLTVDLDSLALPEHFTAPAALGIRLITHSPGIVAAASAAGVECSLLGGGRPGWRAPEPVEKDVDVAVLVANRWAPLAERVLEMLPPQITRDRIEESAHREVLHRMARARILIWPSRIEGHARIAWEARSVGCVPVALDTNPFAVGLDAEHGAVLVHAVDEIAPAVIELLGEPERWESASELGRRTAPAEVDWDPYVRRVAGFLSTGWDADPAAMARAGMGRALQGWVDALAEEAQSARFELSVAKHDLTQATENQVALHGDLESLRAEHDTLRAEHDALRAEHDALRASRAVRAALSARNLLRR